MDAFWRFAKLMISRYRRGLTLALVFAFLSAGGLGVGLLAVGPTLKIILNPNETRILADLATEYNADDPFLGITIPQGIIDALPVEPFNATLMLILALGVLAIFGATTSFLHLYLSQTITTKAVAEIRQEAFEAALYMPLARVVQRGPTEFVARLIRDAAELQRGLIAVVSKSVSQITKGSAALVIGIVVEWRIALVALVLGPILAVTLRKLGKRVRRGTRGSLQAQEGLLRIANESVQGLRAVKVNTGERESLGRFAKVNDDVVHNELRIRTARALSSPLVELLGLFGFGAFVLVASKFIIEGTLEFERFVGVLACLGIAGASFRPLASFVTEMHGACAPATRLADILDERAEDAAETMPDLPPHSTSITFSDIVFTYPACEDPALRGVTVEIKKNERVAIVGPNGCGKTTLVSLLPRLLVPDSGVVAIDGTDLRKVNLKSVRRQMGVVTQETMLFRGTVAENIAFGMEGASRDAIEEAARRGHADSFIQRLANGYDTDLAEFGGSLSGGQRQRLAIARALLRDPSILIMDEATSQIDSESEHHINEALAEFCEDRTALIIAHRLSTVLSADRILVMERGRVIDQGTHDELLGRCATYQRLAQTQLAG